MKTNAMKPVRLLLLAALLVQPLAAGAKMTVSVTSPKKNLKTTNALITAAGKVKSTTPVAAVYYSFNGGAWTPASGTTNWSVPDLALTAGANSFWVYATDTNSACSPTNKVAFTYVVMQPVTVEINGHGMVNPDYSSRLLQIGRSYVANAHADKGYAFTGWTGDVTNASTHLAFVMCSNLTLIATFVDVTAPKLVITTPAASQVVSNSPLVATCRATDNEGVAAVYYQLNGGEWKSDAASLDGTNWTSAALDLTPGANTLKAYAADGRGNRSLTNAVMFNYTVPPFTGFAPASLSGLAGEVVGSLEQGVIAAPFQISFGPASFAISPADTNVPAAAGVYALTPVGSNTVRLTTTLTTPAPWAGSIDRRILVFTNENTCVFTNGDASLGTITFAAVPNRLPSPSARLTVLHWADGEPGSAISVIGGGVFTNYTDFGLPGQVANSWGTNATFTFSPVAAMMQQYYSDPGDAGASAYTLLTFTTATNGTWNSANFDADMNWTWGGSGGFEIVSTANPLAGNAPATIAGKLITVSEGGSTFKVCFGEHTFTIYDPNTSDDNTSVNTYAYYKTGANTGKLVNITVVPPYGGHWTDVSVVNLTFTSASGGTAQGGGSPANFTFTTANNYAPASMTGKSITSRHGGSVIGSGTFNADGTFTFTPAGGGTPETMMYDYTSFSPLGGLMVLMHGDGSTSYNQVQFNSATAGSWYQTDYDSLGNYLSVDTGTFTVN